MDLDACKDVLLPTTRADKIVTGVRGEEVRVDDGTGEKWVVDASSQVGTNPLGHRPPELMAAIEELYGAEEEPLMVAGNDFYHERLQALAETLTDIYPGDQAHGDIKAYYCNSGSEAVERGCLKAAQLFQGGNTYAAFRGAFHGRTSLALSCNFSKAEQTEGYNSLFRAFPVSFPGPDDDVDAALDELRELIIQEGRSNINAVVAEPVQGEGGYIVPHEEFLPGVRDITAEYDIPLVMDEVQASLRTGEWFACENWGVEPDMVAGAKAFSGGITPFGFSLIKEEYATTEQGKHGSTYGPNPKGCFVALKTIEIIQDHDYLSHAAAMGDVLDTAWRDLEEHDIVVEERGMGVMRGIEFADPDVRDAVLDTLYEEHDVLTMACGNDAINPTIRFLLPVNVDEETVEHIADAVIHAVAAHD